MFDVSSKISQYKLVPVIKLENSENAVPLGEALWEGGLPVAEITFRTDAALESIEKMAKAHPEILIGAGTVINLEQVKSATQAGAQFIVTAGFKRDVTEYCVNNNIPIFPGACTPTELMFLLEYNLTVAKFFPAAQYGGLATIKALAAPFPQIKFMPTGGITADNILEYLSFPKIIACGGSWMVKDELIKEKNFETIKESVKQAVELIKSLS